MVLSGCLTNVGNALVFIEFIMCVRVVSGKPSVRTTDT